MSGSEIDQSVNDRSDPSVVRLSVYLKSRHLVDVIFGCILVIAFPVILFRFGENQYFKPDDWRILSERSMTVHGLFDPYIGHCIAALVFIWLALLHIVGLRSYRIFQLPVVAAHLTTCACLYVICKRSTVRPWIAACVCASLILFGPGYLDIISAFQISFTGSIAFGLIAMLLVDTGERQLSWRDGLALVFGLAALLFSAAGVAMVIAVGVAVWCRRGLRTAALHTIPLGILFLIWFFAFPSTKQLNKPQGNTVRVGYDVTQWTAHAYAHAFNAITNIGLPAAGVVSAALLVCGLSLGLRHASIREKLRARGLVIACTAASVTFVLLSGIERAGRLEDVSSSHYLYVYSTLLFPAIALGCEVVIRRWRTLGTVAVAALLFAGVKNANSLYRTDHAATIFPTSQAAKLLATVGAYPPAGRAVPPSIVSYPFVFALPAPWILENGRQGRLPPAPPADDPIWNFVRINYGVVQRPGIGPTTRCTSQIDANGMVIEPRQGQSLGLQTRPQRGAGNILHRSNPPTVTLQLVDQWDRPLFQGGVTVNAAIIRKMEVLDGELRILVTSSSPSFRLCGL